MFSQAEIFQDLNRRTRFVQRVKMQSRHPRPQQFLALPRGVFHAEFNRSRLVISQRVQSGTERRRNFCAAKLREPDGLRRVQDGDYAGHDRYADTQFAGNMITKFKKIRVVEKKLRQHKIRTGIHFGLQMPPVGVFAGFAGQMPLGKTRDAGGKICRTHE